MERKALPEPARSALYFIAHYQMAHPDVGLPDAVRLSRLLTGSDRFLSWHDDGMGRFEVKRGDQLILMLDLTPLMPAREE